MPTDQQLEVTSPSEWGRKKEIPEDVGFVVELPTGNVIRMRRTMDMVVLLRQGQVPNPLAGIVQKMIDTGNPNFPSDANAQVAVQLLDLLDASWMKAVMEPEFDAPPQRGKDANGRNIQETQEQYMDRIAGWTPKEGAISIFDVDIQDKLYVFVVAQGAAADLAQFREVSDESLAAVQAGKRIPKQTKRTGGARSKK